MGDIGHIVDRLSDAHCALIDIMDCRGDRIHRGSRLLHRRRDLIRILVCFHYTVIDMLKRCVQILRRRHNLADNLLQGDNKQIHAPDKFSNLVRRVYCHALRQISVLIIDFLCYFSNLSLIGNGRQNNSFHCYDHAHDKQHYHNYQHSISDYNCVVIDIILLSLRQAYFRLLLADHHLYLVM